MVLCQSLYIFYVNYTEISHFDEAENREALRKVNINNSSRAVEI